MEKNIASPTEAWGSTLIEEQIIACIAWHFRRDHFREGSWISESVAGGYMKTLVEGFFRKYEGV